MDIGDLIEWTWCVGPGDRWETFNGMIVNKRRYDTLQPCGNTGDNNWTWILDVLETTGEMIVVQASDARVI
tara:strand:- start:80 stop:292 length:213 start_codon:yes stop_codon:yes gene_type:complete